MILGSNYLLLILVINENRFIMYIKISILFLLTIILASCGKSTQECAEESLVGEWNVVQVFEAHTIVMDGSQTSQSQTAFDDAEGHFSFTASMMDYEFTTTSTKTLDQAYTLVVTKENSGFTKVNVFTINGDVEDFRVRFGDQTSDAHENATEISLEQSISSDTLIIQRFIELIRE